MRSTETRVSATLGSFARKHPEVQHTKTCRGPGKLDGVAVMASWRAQYILESWHLGMEQQLPPAHRPSWYL